MHQIRYFLAVCDKGAFTRAAQYVYVSQPSLTQAIKKLEEELGGELFKRDRSGCQLTSLGRLVEPKLRQIFQETQTIKAEAIRFNRLNTVPLKIGLMATIGAQRLSPFLATYQQDFPQIEMELIVGCETSLLKQLEKNELDIVITSPVSGINNLPYDVLMLYKERYVVAFNQHHRFNQTEQLSLKDIQSEAYLDRLNCELREILKNVCQDRGINLYATYRSNNEAWILNMVRAGIGIALMPEFSLALNDDSVNYRYLVDPELSRTIYAIYMQQPPDTPEFEKLIANLGRAF